MSGGGIRSERKEYELTFTFQIKSDSAQGVAEEMVQQFNIDHKFTNSIKKEIENIVQPY